MKKFILSLITLIAFTGITMAQMPDAITIEPDDATAQDSIKLWVNTNHTCPDEAMDTVTNMHIHSGANLDGTEWQNLVSFDSTDMDGNSITALTQENDTMWYIEMVPAEFYSVPDTSTMIEINAVFNNGSWDAEAKDFDEDGNCTDFIIPLKFNIPTTFSVDMSAFADTSDFDPSTDEVYMAGSMFGWSGPGEDEEAMMTDEDEDLIYTWSGDLLSNTEYEYKYFYLPEGEDSSWDYGEWDGGSNRVFTTGDSEMEMNEMWGMFKLSFTVTTDGETPLEGADVTVNEETAASDADGHALHYALPDDSVSYTVSHADYADFVYGVQMDFADVDVMVDMSTANVEDAISESFNMYPNPSTRVLNIDGLDNVNKVEIYNAVGQRVHTENNVSNSVQIATSNLKNGLYFVNFYKDRNVVATQKFLKK